MGGFRVRESQDMHHEAGGGQGSAGAPGTEGPGVKGAYLLKSGRISSRRERVSEPGARIEKRGQEQATDVS